ncbi:TetR/AcrR family transcriptional regulator [Paenibacillus oenotherae]|uniref:TetR/AcrR family transcriptional regulator n=1 Tax=Paenibacillus oenotherae TaxID=1435645 RepID=A0ABS7D1Y0_9BACL|nr:TetR/AcrR family transcriptional regulator [Paenibacillus oenotherae]MBW7473592.1 TetR/AcrR family transcriptional regulator [Paenibacillus oenotherae]
MSDTIEQWFEEILKLDAEGNKMTEKQSKILQAAIDVFAEKGYAASSTSEIAQRAGVAEGTIFRHYKTKKDLLLSIVAPVMAKLIAPFVLRDFSKVLDAEFESYESFLRALIDNRIEFLKRHMNVLRIMIQEIPFHSELQQQFQNVVLAQVLERLGKIVSKFQAEGHLIALPPETIIRLTASTVMGYVFIRTFYGEREGAIWDDEFERQATIDFIIRGLGTKQ